MTARSISLPFLTHYLHCLRYSHNVKQAHKKNTLKLSSPIQSPHFKNISCCFIMLQERTRAALLDGLYQDLHQNNIAIFGQLSLLDSSKVESGGLFDTFKRAISGKVRTSSLDSTPYNNSLKRTSPGNTNSTTLPSVTSVNETSPSSSVVCFTYESLFPPSIARNAAQLAVWLWFWFPTPVLRSHLLPFIISSLCLHSLQSSCCMPPF